MARNRDRDEAVAKFRRGFPGNGRRFETIAEHRAGGKDQIFFDRAAVGKAEEQLAKAEAAGDERRIEEAKANLATRQEWLSEAEKSAPRR